MYCRTTIAGPGAGKTLGMVRLAQQEFSSCPPHRIIAVVTYTNEAAREISSRLSQVLTSHGNVFVGTIHSFLIRFILHPLGQISGVLSCPSSFVDSAQLPYPVDNRFAKRALERKKADELVRHGFVTFDKVLDLANSVVAQEHLARAIGRRLHAIFVDEYQDARILQHQILMSILEMEESRLFVVGDPMQSIFNFTYSSSQLKNEPAPETSADLPLVKLSDQDLVDGFECEVVRENYRSVPAVVRLLNQLNRHIKQVAEREDNGIPVLFLEDTSVEGAVGSFVDAINALELPAYEGKIERLILSRVWATFHRIPTRYGAVRVGNDLGTVRSTLADAERAVCGLLNLSMRSIVQEVGIPPIEFRKFVLSVLRDLKSGAFENNNHRQNFVRKRFEMLFNVELDNTLRGSINVFKTLERLFGRGDAGCLERSRIAFSTIHTAKGLEAQSVLVIAPTAKALAKWLQIEKGDNRLHDERNLGFVAFSRARDVLCVSCLEDTSPLRDRMLDLGIVF